MIYGFAAATPLSIWFALRQLTGLKVILMTTVCLYGYSLFVFIPATVRYGFIPLVWSLALRYTTSYYTLLTHPINTSPQTLSAVNACQLCCLYPSPLISWLAMIGATASSTLFLLVTPPALSPCPFLSINLS